MKPLNAEWSNKCMVKIDSEKNTKCTQKTSSLKYYKRQLKIFENGAIPQLLT